LAWNALTITALVNAHLVFGDKRFLTDSETCASFIDDKLTQDDGSLYRVYCKGKSNIPAFFDDYAFLIQAYISLYKATYNEDWLIKAKDLVEITIGKFFCEESGMFYYTDENQNNIIVRKMELTDGVIPSSGAIMADNLMELGVYFREQLYLDMAQQMTANICAQIDRGGPYIYRWAGIYLKHLVASAEVTAAGESAIDSLRSIVGQSNHPFLIPFNFVSSSRIPIADYAADDNGIKLCMGSNCQLPLSSPSQVIESIEKGKTLWDFSAGSL
jgi:hypothetical protein